MEVFNYYFWDYLLTLLLIFPYIFYISKKMKFDIHMLQLNSYMNERYMRWYQQNSFQTFSYFDFAPLLILFLASGFNIGNFKVIPLMLVFVFYWVLVAIRPKKVEKKKLVYTPRVKRLICATILVVVAYFAVLYFVDRVVSNWYLNEIVYKAVDLDDPTIPLRNLSVSDLIDNFQKILNIIGIVWLVVLSVTTPFFVLLANVLISPIESLINKRYFNEAKKILSSMSNLKIIGITGSYGKTSTKHMLHKFLSQQFNTVMTPESYNTPMGVVRTVREHLKPIHEIFICEMGAKNIGDIKELCELAHPQYGVLTSIGEQHLETFKTVENVVSTKFELVDMLPDDGIAFLNFDNEYIKSHSIQKNYISYSTKSSDSMYYTKNIESSQSGTKFVLCTKSGEEIEISTRLLGRLNVLNIVAAASVAMELGMKPHQIAFAAKTLEPIPHRLELKMHSPGLTVIDDAFNSNPQGAKMALEVLSNFTNTKRVLITPGMVELGDRELELNRQFGVQAAACCDYAILVGKSRAIPINEGLISANFPEENIYIARDLNDAIAQMNKVCTDGGVVLFENDLPDNYLE